MTQKETQGIQSQETAAPETALLQTVEPDFAAPDSAVSGTVALETALQDLRLSHGTAVDSPVAGRVGLAEPVALPTIDPFTPNQEKAVSEAQQLVFWARSYPGL